eukprot:10308378-Heterocapsa_arctica.AAC.1
MMEAICNGSRKTSADAEFRRSVTDNLLYRAKWDNTYTFEQKVQRAKDGCSRWFPGRHFPPWKLNAVGVVDPGREGFEQMNYAAFLPGEDVRSKMYKMLYVGIISDDIEDTEGYSSKR